MKNVPVAEIDFAQWTWRDRLRLIRDVLVAGKARFPNVTVEGEDRFPETIEPMAKLLHAQTNHSMPEARERAEEMRPDVRRRILERLNEHR